MAPGGRTVAASWLHCCRPLTAPDQHPVQRLSGSGPWSSADDRMVENCNFPSARRRRRRWISRDGVRHASTRTDVAAPGATCSPRHAPLRHRRLPRTRHRDRRSRSQPGLAGLGSRGCGSGAATAVPGRSTWSRSRPRSSWSPRPPGRPCSRLSIFLATNLTQVFAFVALTRRWTPQLWALGGDEPLRRVSHLGRLTLAAAFSGVAGMVIGFAGASSCSTTWSTHRRSPCGGGATRSPCW